MLKSKGASRGRIRTRGRRSAIQAAKPCSNRRCVMGEIGNRAWGLSGLILILTVSGAAGEARAQGLSVVTLDGRMIDLPVAERARKALARP